jgi:hypothetical protein
MCKVLSTEQEMTPTKNEIDLQAQNFVVNEFLLSSLKASAQYTLSLNARYFSSAFINKAVCRSCQEQSIIPHV